MSDLQASGEVEIYLEGDYIPSDYFDGPQVFHESDAVVTFENGKVRISPNVKSCDYDHDAIRAWIARINYMLELRQVISTALYTFNGLAKVKVFADGHRVHDVSAETRIIVRPRVMATGVTLIPGSPQAEDPREMERVAHRTFMERGLRHVSNELAGKLIRSFSRARKDPSNLLVHLYEIRDAVGQFFGGEKGVREKLGVTRAEWSRFGQLANDAPVSESRHRGTHIELRPASEEEKLAAMGFARRLIEAYFLYLEETPS
ncbi:hypothetical protein OJF2_49120 [Aquisphaera giovannonii]|uniref:ApeA N-terminal domain-containing protein n=1 Tax=Aquisphaera giovannonii TaxID=406548 RepID=A0A5B9W8L0_9BACT|nr:hypothetical protein [Aquisphaera giovannonii]QEH36351.1 hypothetical protein OJF2_49120 [Aquisphaera giovannonii]